MPLLRSHPPGHSADQLFIKINKILDAVILLFSGDIVMNKLVKKIELITSKCGNVDKMRQISHEDIMTNKKTKTKYEKKSVDSGNMCYDAQLTICTFTIGGPGGRVVKCTCFLS